MCYESLGQEMELLSELIASQSEHLTPVNILRIVEDIIKAVASLQKNFISHGCIDSNAIIIHLPNQVFKTKMIK